MCEWISRSGKIVPIKIRTLPKLGPDDSFSPQGNIEMSAGDLALIYDLRDANAFVDDLMEMYATGGFHADRLLAHFGGRPSHNPVRRSTFIRDCKLAIEDARRFEVTA